MAETEYYRDSLGRETSRQTKTKAEVEGNLAGAASGTTAGKGLGAKGKGGAGMPKQSDYPTLAAYMTAMREYRQREDADPVGQKQKQLLRGMK